MLNIDSEKLAKHITDNQIDRLVVGYSGGLDSQVLLHWLNGWLKQADMKGCKPGLYAVHINHGLSANAEAWQIHCEQTCQSLQVPLEVFRVEVSRQGNLEENAREARYSCFAGLLEASDLLLLAHHKNDQIETAVFKLLRGDGFRGMPETRLLGKSRLYRPLLGCERSELESWARSEGLLWVDDESNVDPGFDRNFIRHQVLPLLRERWNDLDKRFVQLLEKEAAREAILDELAQMDFEQVKRSPGSICLKQLKKLDPLRQRNVLYHWIGRASYSHPSPGYVLELLRQISESRGFSLDWKFISVREYQSLLFLVRNTSGELPVWPESLKDILDNPVHGLHLESCIGRGIKMEYLDKLKIGYRSGGERIRRSGHLQSSSLKNLLQEANIPSWIRDRIPLIYRGEELIAIPALPQWNLEMITTSEVISGRNEAGYVPVWYDEAVL